MNRPPPLTDEQRRQALIKAAEARRLRAEIKELLKMGSLSLEDLLERSDTDETLGRMKVLAVLESLPRLGKVKARRTMEEIGISETSPFFADAYKSAQAIAMDKFLSYNP